METTPLKPIEVMKTLKRPLNYTFLIAGSKRPLILCPLGLSCFVEFLLRNNLISALSQPELSSFPMFVLGPVTKHYGFLNGALVTCQNV